MRNEKFHMINVVGIVVSLLFFFSTVYLQIRDGYARDERIYVPDFIGNGLWLLLIGCVVCFIIFLNASKIKRERISKIVSSITLVTLIVFGLIITFGWFLSYNQIK